MALTQQITVAMQLLSLISLAHILTQCSFEQINVQPAGRFLEGPGARLFLSPYIRSGNIARARELARVPSLPGVESYSGYLTIDETNNANMFFWFFPAENNPEKAPLAVWLQGGPGAPSVFAVFREHGPFVVTESLNLEKRRTYWTKEISIVYIDNPVGTGFSFTDPKGYVSNQSEVGRDLYATLLQFFQLFPEYRKNDFYITGESYGGKYVTAAAYTIHINNPSAQHKINLRGVVIGNGFVDPENMVPKYGDYLFHVGLIDSKTLRKFNEAQAKIVYHIKSGQFRKAFGEFNALLGDEWNKYNDEALLFYDATGFRQLFNYVTANTSMSERGVSKEVVRKWLDSDRNRRNIHVGPQKFDDGHLVKAHQLDDFMNTVKPWLEELMNGYRVLLYNGQFDIICAYPLMVNFLEKLQWSGKALYDIAERKKWYVNGELAGFAKTGGNFTEILVRNAGHMVPADQPFWAFDMITKFTRNIPF